MTDDKRSNFLTELIDADLAAGRHTSVVTRFPPEPNGYPHIGHAKSICLNWGIAQRYGGRFHLRFDDTNPVAEDEEFVAAIERDVKWLLDVDHLDHVFWASDYFEQMYGFAVELVRKGLAYVDSQTPEQVRIGRGDFNTPGTPSPFRDRSPDENLALLEQMRRGELAEGAAVLRARIDMSSPNMLMRDPLLYRIKHAAHHNTGDAWCIYPMYDFAHCLEDSIEHITHSFCTLEFENNRELYDWLLDNVSAPSRPHQYEFARLNLDYTVVSKRKLKQLVTEHHVDGWDDPRMPTIAGLRRRGVRASAIRAFCDLVGVAKNNSVVDIGKLEFAIRDDLNTVAPRALGVLDPLRVTVTDATAATARTLDAPLWPDAPEHTERREIPFSGQLYIERADFALAPPPGFKRLTIGGAVRLRHAGTIVCDEAVTDASGAVVELRCHLDDDADASGVIHWVDAATSVPCEVRLYDRLFAVAAPGDDPTATLHDELNPESLVVMAQARVEPWLAAALRDAIATPSESPRLHLQLERLGYFVPDRSATASALVLNRVVTLKDSWARQQREDVDLAELRAEKDRARASQAARSEQRDPAAVAADRGPETRARFDALVGAGVDALVALPIATDAARYDYVTRTAAYDSGAAEVAKLFANVVHPAWPDGGTAPYPASAFDALAAAAASRAISGAEVKLHHAAMCESGVFSVDAIQRADAGAVAASVARVVAANPDAVEKYRGGKVQLLGFLLGTVMRDVGAGADAAAVKAALTAALDAQG
ncbi:MAG: glutamine--tRNA ligase/YqeY domain fusion protein [Myxococcales bacterium]|nr:glutamine--tRNA ligase/YqeY domain fusion protein [Myxococcales bacterium]